MQQTIILDDIKGSDLLDSLKGSGFSFELSRLKPQEKYTISIQPTEYKKSLVADLQRFLDVQTPDPAVAGKSEEEIMGMVNEIIEECRAGQTQKK